MYPLAVLEARGLKSRCQQGQGHALSEGSREDLSCLFQLLVVAGNRRRSLACSCSTQSLPPSSMSWLSPLCVCVSGSKFPSSYKNTGHIGFRAHPKPVRPHLNLITAAKTLFPNRPHLQVPGGQDYFGRHYSRQYRWDAEFECDWKGSCVEGMKFSPPSDSQGGPLGPRHFPHCFFLLVIPPPPPSPSFLLLQRPPSPSLLYYRSGNRGPGSGTAGPRPLRQFRNRAGIRSGPLTPPHPTPALPSVCLGLRLC